MATGTVIGGPEECDLKRVRGDDKPLVIVLKDESTGTAIDVTGYTGDWTINTEKDPVTTANQQATVPGAPTATPTDGKIVFSPTVGNMDLLGKLFYDIQITDDQSKLQTVLKGKITFLQDITK